MHSWKKLSCSNYKETGSKSRPRQGNIFCADRERIAWGRWRTRRDGAGDANDTTVGRSLVRYAMVRSSTVRIIRPGPIQAGDCVGRVLGRVGSRAGASLDDAAVAQERVVRLAVMGCFAMPPHRADTR